MPVFSLEEARALQVKNISQNNFKYWSESAVYGYFGGGQQAPGFICTITRLEFSSETLSNPGKNLPTSLGFQSGVASGLYGYFGGGYFTPVATSYNTISRLDFSNEIMSLPGKNLPGTLWGFITSKIFFGSNIKSFIWILWWWICSPRGSYNY